MDNLENYHSSFNVENTGYYQPASNYKSDTIGTVQHPVYQNNSLMKNTCGNTMANKVSLTPETMTNTDFLPGYLSQFKGKWIRAEFFINGSIEQQVGILHDVGASYIIIKAIEPETLVVCDIYSLKFTTIVLEDDYGKFLGL